MMQCLMLQYLAKKINPDPVMYEDWTRKMMPKVCSETYTQKNYKIFLKELKTKTMLTNAKLLLLECIVSSNECVKRKIRYWM